MRFEPHAYQAYAIDFIETHPEAALFLSMGLGKTVITLTAVGNLILDRFAVRRVLVIAPLRVARDTWPEELRKWDHLKGLSWAVAVGTETERRAALARNAAVTIINRENLPWLVARTPWNYDMVVIDELSSFKNHQAVRFKALKAVRERVRRIVGLTGTPAPNGLIDLWAEFRLLDGGRRLGRLISDYRRIYFKAHLVRPPYVCDYTPLPGAQQLIERKISDITISMNAVEHLDMPELLMQEAVVEMSDEELTVYRELRDNLCVGDVTAASAGVLAGKLCQIANGAVYNDDQGVTVVHSRKLDALEDLAEAAAGEPLLVAYWFQHDAQRIKERLPQARMLKSAADMEAWKAGQVPVGLIHPASAGHGLNLQSGGRLLVWYGLTWSLELYQQTNARLYRQGQKARAVVIKHIITKGTIDEAILRALASKRVTQDELISAVKVCLL